MGYTSVTGKSLGTQWMAIWEFLNNNQALSFLGAMIRNRTQCPEVMEPRERTVGRRNGTSPPKNVKKQLYFFTFYWVLIDI